MKWKRMIGWTLLGALALVILGFAAVYAVVHTAAFNRWLLAKVIQEAEKGTGGRVAIQSLSIDWKKLDADVYGLALYGTVSGSRPVFEAEHVLVGVKIVSLLRRKFDLAELVLDRPALRLLVDAHGNSNMPHSPSQNSSASPNELFDLAIGHMAINSGEIYYKDERVPLTADLQNVQAQINYGALSGDYKGSLGYEHGRIQAKDFSPIEHSLQVQFIASRQGIAAQQLVVITEKSRLRAKASLSNYADPSIEGTYEAVLDTNELARVLKSPSIPAGQISASGSVRYQNIPGRAFIDAAYVDGQARSARLELKSGRILTPVRAVQGKYRIESGNLYVSGLQANVLGGAISASMEMLNLAGRSKSILSASVRNLSLAQFGDTLPVGTLQRVRVGGSANAEVQATWSASLANLVAHCHATITSGNQPTAPTPAIPLNGNVDVKYDAASDTASFGQSYLRTGATEVSLSGILSKNSILSIQANTSDLHELTSLVDEVRLATSTTAASPTLPYDIWGSANFTGQMRGAVTAPNLQGQLTANNLQVDGSEWRMLRTNLSLSPSAVALQNGFLANMAQGQLSFSGNIALRDWAVAPISAIALRAQAVNLSVADVERLAKANYPVTGVLAANISIEGTRQAPAGQGVIQLSKASIWQEPVNNLTVHFTGASNQIHSTEQLQVPAGTISADLSYSLPTEEYDATVHTTGLKLEQIHAVQTRDLGISGTLTASGSGRGTLKKPQFTANLQIPQLHAHDQTISQIQGQLTVAHENANFGLSATAAQGSVEAKGTVDLTGGYATMASLDVRQLPIGPLLASYFPEVQTGVEGQTEIHATVNGPLKNPKQLVIDVEIPTLNLQYSGAQIGLVQPLRLDYRNDVATLQRTELKGPGTDLTLQGTIPVNNIVQSTLTAKGAVDLSLLQDFTRDVKSSGVVDIDISAAGVFSAKGIRGQLQIKNAALTTETIPVGLEGVNGAISLSGNRLDITQFSGKAGGGEIGASGFLTYGSRAAFSVNATATNVRVRYPQGLRSVLNANLRLTGSPQDSLLSGRVILDRLSFTQQFDLSNFIGQFDAELPSTSSAFENNMKLNIAFQSGDQLEATNSKLSIAGAANLNINGTLGNPVLLGRMTLNSGEIFFLGKRYDVQSGTIEFSNPVHTEPVLNLYVATTVEQYNITLNFTGPVDRLRTNYTSTPPLPPADIINLLALGQTAEESATSTTPASVGAESVLAQGVSSQLSSKIEKLTGISQLTFDPMAGNNQADPAAQIAVQERVTGNLLVTFSTDVTSSQATTVQVRYQTTPQTSVTVVRDQYDGYAVTLQLHKTF